METEAPNGTRAHSQTANAWQHAHVGPRIYTNLYSTHNNRSTVPTNPRHKAPKYGFTETRRGNTETGQSAEAAPRAARSGRSRAQAAIQVEETVHDSCGTV